MGTSCCSAIRSSTSSRNRKTKTNMAENRHYYPEFDPPPSYEASVGTMNASGFVDPNYSTLPEQNQDLRFVKQAQPQQLEQLHTSLFHQYPGDCLHFTPSVCFDCEFPRFGKKSVLMNCPRCLNRITTTVINGGSSSMAWVLGGVLCVLGFWLCACIPCMYTSQTVKHKCPNCKKTLGRYNG